jgi:hypothetical protein
LGQGVRKKLLAVVGGGFLAFGATAEAATLTAERAVDRSCSQAERSDAGVAKQTMAAPSVSGLTARLSGARGNWNLAVFDAGSGHRIASSSFARGDEVATGFTIGGGPLVVQACRLSGGDETAELSVAIRELETEGAQPKQLVRVATPTEVEKNALVATGLDLTEHGGPDYLDVVLHSPAEGQMLRDKGFEYEVVAPDLLQATFAERAAEQRAARGGGGAGGLPSGRTGPYRVLSDYNEEMQALAEENRRLVRHFTLPFETLDGRKVEGIEVAPRVRRKDGRPTFVMLGAHHAREWPSSEHAIEFAHELVKGWKGGNRGIRRLMRRARVVVVPVVNPDGFVVSRESVAAMTVPDGRPPAPGGLEEAYLALHQYEYHRKNCRVVGTFVAPNVQDEADCMGQPSTGVSQFGVDPNRNYGTLWGGPGASAEDTPPFGVTAQDYRGPGPFSEAETRNVKWLISRRQAVTMITNHTFSNLVLHAPGLQSYGKPVDDRAMRRLAAKMASENGYTDQAGYELYDTSGTTEDWSYNSTGGYGYTFEIGLDGFHPPYADAVIAEYRGTSPEAGDGGGNRAAYLHALRSTVKSKQHSVIRGTAPPRAFLTLKKRFKTPTSPVLDGAGEEGDVIRFREKLKTTMRARRSGKFTWHVNPSTRPLVDPRRKLPKPRSGQPSDPEDFTGTPGPGATPCADFDTDDPDCWNDHDFNVPGGPGIDNGEATVRISWAEPVSDWDLKVFRDSDGDGSSEGETELVGSSGSAPTTSEETTITRPGLRRGPYVARVINYAAGSPYDGRVTFGKTGSAAIKQKRETWKLTCRASKKGPVLARQKVFVKRGKRAIVNLVGACQR